AKSNLRVLRGTRLLLNGDMSRLPMPDVSADVVLANLPFGIRVGERAGNRPLYRGFLQEATRILRVGGRFVAYTQDRKSFEAAAEEYGLPRPSPITMVNAGGLSIGVYKIVKG